MEADLSVSVGVQQIENIFHSLSCIILNYSWVNFHKYDAGIQYTQSLTLLSPSMVITVPITSSISLAEMVPCFKSLVIINSDYPFFPTWHVLVIQFKSPGQLLLYWSPLCKLCQLQEFLNIAWAVWYKDGKCIHESQSVHCYPDQKCWTAAPQTSPHSLEASRCCTGSPPAPGSSGSWGTQPWKYWSKKSQVVLFLFKLVWCPSLLVLLHSHVFLKSNESVADWG